MGRILCCWELGGGYGHLYSLLPFVLELKRRRHKVVVAAQNLTRAEQAYGEHAVAVIQAPVWKTPYQAFPTSINYAQNLLRNGYWNGHALKANLKAWLHLFETLQPDLVLAEHSPTALLAARCLEIPRAAIGSGFVLPPCSSPMPSLQPWFPIPQRILLAREQTVVELINAVLATLGFRLIRMLADIFQDAETFLTTHPELDHYGPRQGIRYWGSVHFVQGGIEPVWPKSGEAGVFMYLNYGCRFLRQILELIRELDLPVLAFIRDMPEQEREAVEGGNLRISPGPVDLRKVVEQCHLIITHGGVNTGSCMLLSGKALLLLPEQLEQCLWGYRIVEQKLGIMTNWFAPQPDFKKKINQLVNSADARRNALEFSSRYRDHDPGKTVREICARLSNMCGWESSSFVR